MPAAPDAKLKDNIIYMQGIGNFVRCLDFIIGLIKKPVV